MELRSEGIITKIKPFRNNSYIITCFTSKYGVLTGLGYINKKNLGSEITKGSIVNVLWKARLPEHLGRLTLELVKLDVLSLYFNKLSLLTWGASIELINKFLNENEPHEELYKILIDLSQSIASEKPLDIAKNYIAFEVALLREIGYGLDLFACVKTGTDNNLHYVSPKSARAVSVEAAKGYEDKLLLLPQFLIDANQHPCAKSINSALNLTGYFLEKYSREFFKKTSFALREQLVKHCLAEIF